jgi:hypothetical protein
MIYIMLIVLFDALTCSVKIRIAAVRSNRKCIRPKTIVSIFYLYLNVIINILTINTINYASCRLDLNLA